MKKLAASTFVIIMFAAIPLVGGDLAEDREAIRLAALDYIEGWFEGNPERMDRALHPELAKRAILSSGTGEKFLNLTKAQMVEATKNGGGKAVAADKRAIKIDILDVYRDIASVRVESVSFIDYLQLARAEGKWKIVNVLWLTNVKERKEVAVDPKILATYAGEYELRPGFILTVTPDNARLFVQATGQPKFEVYPSAESEFFLKVVEAQITFVKDAQGTVTSLVLHQGGADVPAKKIK